MAGLWLFILVYMLCRHSVALDALSDDGSDSVLDALTEAGTDAEERAQCVPVSNDALDALSDASGLGDDIIRSLGIGSSENAPAAGDGLQIIELNPCDLQLAPHHGNLVRDDALFVLARTSRCTADEGLGPVAYKSVELFCDPANNDMYADKFTSESHGVGVNKWREYRESTAAVGLAYEQCEWRSMERCVVQSATDTESVSLHCYAECVTYDGVDLYLSNSSHNKPMKPSSATDQETPAGDVSGIAAAAADGQHDLGLVPAIPEYMEIVGEVTKGPMKIMQSEMSTILSVEIGGRPCVISGQHITPLTRSDRSTTECQAKLLENTSVYSEMRDSFPRKLRLACTGRHGPTGLTEHHITEQRGLGWSNVLIWCHMHILASGHKAVTAVYNVAACAIAGFTRAMHCPGEFPKIRQSAYRVIASKVEFTDTTS